MPRPRTSLCNQPNCPGVSSCPHCQRLKKQQQRSAFSVTPPPADDPESGTPNQGHESGTTPQSGTDVPDSTQSVPDSRYTPATFGQPNHIPYWQPLPGSPEVRKCSACGLLLRSLLCVDGRARCQQCLSRTAKFYPQGSDQVDPV